MEEAQNRIFYLKAQIEVLFALDSDTALSKIRRHFALNDVEMEILATLAGGMSEEPLFSPLFQMLSCSA